MRSTIMTDRVSREQPRIIIRPERLICIIADALPTLTIPVLANLEPTKMEGRMARRIFTWHQLAAVAAILLLGACAQNPPQAVASNPPPVAPGPNAAWHHVYFDTNSFAINADGHKVITDLIASMRSNPDSVATIIGRTDPVGSKDFNMHLSHKRADAVRDALVYDGTVAMDRVETRWTGESRQTVAPANEDPAASNRGKSVV